MPLAYKEGVITGMEFLWSHGAVIQAGEFRHGPLEIVESGVPFLFLVPTDSSRVITQRALKFVEKWKGTAIVLDYANFARDFMMIWHRSLCLYRWNGSAIIFR